MTIDDKLEQLLATSRARLSAELHDPQRESAAHAYARSLWGLEDDLRALMNQIREGADQ